MRLQGSALRLTIFVGEDDQWHHKPLYHEVVSRARKQGLAGASVMRGIEGFGASSRIHTTRILTLSDDLPIGNSFTIGVTSYAYPAEGMAEQAVRLMRERLKDPARAPIKVVVPGRLIIRASSAGVGTTE